MPMSTFQKVTLATCLVLCVALLLPRMLLSRGRKDAAERPDGSGNFPPMMHRQTAPEGRGQRTTAASFSRAHSSETAARGKGAGTGAGTGGKSNLAGQIIPVYGFGILLYILYILFKITSKGNSKPSEGRFPSVRSENMKRKITDYELDQLQEKLRETELVMEKIVSSAHHSPDRVNGVTADQEESLLQQLMEITRVMQEGQLVEGMVSERKAQNDWEEYPEEPQQYWEHPQCSCQHSQQHCSPQAETEEAMGTQDDGADVAENVPAEDVLNGGEAEDALDLSTDPGRESVFTALSEEGSTLESDLGLHEEDSGEHKEGEGQIHLGAPEEDLTGALKELEFTLKMTSAIEQEKIEDLTGPVATESSSSLVRRRNRRRRAKKASH